MGDSDQFVPATDEAISSALDAMWNRHRTQILERVAVLDDAAAAVAAGKLTAVDREAAQAAAHKLAGTLGMFNLMHGTELARELEKTYAQESAPPATSAEHLVSLTSEIRILIETRKTG
ncbi:MAG TPA: Hpt domain-containing protein [Terracidiphilus sp.]|nr:Hpt domain-containing protein [Terracidiphilus sp.]